MKGITALVGLAGLAAVVACQPNEMIVTTPESGEARLAELWIDPGPARDLYYGPGGPALEPNPSARYRVIEIKVGGFSEGYTVLGPDDREWSAKFPPEASTEVVASRIHWGLGYHQPPIYFVREWHADGATAPNPQLPARFREDEPDLHGLEDEGDWSFYANPFVGTRELAGLLVLQVLLGNSDLKDSNNSLFELEEAVEAADRWYVVRDIGHTLGRTGMMNAARGDADAFESSPFIRGVAGDRVELAYDGQHAALFENIRAADVRWICERLSRFTDEQWQDAFRAGGYPSPLADRFIRKIKAKVAEGLAVPE